MDSTNQISGWESLYASAQQCFGLNNETHYRRELSRFGLNRLGPGCYVLDMGCGVGGAMKALRETNVGHIFGVDISLDLLRQAKPLGPVLATSCVSTGLASGVFDVVLIIGLLHHLEDYEDVESTLSEVYRLLKPGGRLVLNEPAPTYFRRLVTPLLLSPLANLTSYSRTMRELVKYEMPVLEHWLSNFVRLVPSIRAAGLRLDWVKLGLLRVSLLASKESIPTKQSAVDLYRGEPSRAEKPQGFFSFFADSVHGNASELFAWGPQKSYLPEKKSKGRPIFGLISYS